MGIPSLTTLASKIEKRDAFLKIHDIREQNVRWFKENYSDLMANYPNTWVIIQSREPRVYAGHDLPRLIHDTRMQMKLKPDSLIVYMAKFGSFNPNVSTSYIILDINPETLADFLP